MTKILFVCHGNICRSPMAEFVLKDMVKQRGLEQQFEIASAATSREEIGNPVYPPARRKLAEHGIGCAGHRARQMTKHDYEYYDLIVCITAYIETNCDTVSLRSAAAHFGYHPVYLSRLLSEKTGKTFSELLLSARMHRARLLLDRTDLSIEKVAAMLGYGNSSNFYKAFRGSCGLYHRSRRVERHAPVFARVRRVVGLCGSFMSRDGNDAGRSKSKGNTTQIYGNQ